MKKIENKKLILIFRIISLLIIIACLIALILWQLDNLSNKNIQKDLSNYVKEIEPEPDNLTNFPINDIEVDFASLKQRNSDTVAYILVPNTNIDYAIVQASDNNYYLHHNFDNKNNSAGWIFAESSNNFGTLDQNTIIYGHNRRNGTMFSNLTYLLDSSWYDNEENKYFNFVTENHHYIAEIFSVYEISAEDVTLVTKFSTSSKFLDDVNNNKSQSIYNFNVAVNANDKIITLYTCNNNTKYRVIVIAKLTVIQ